MQTPFEHTRTFTEREILRIVGLRKTFSWKRYLFGLGMIASGIPLLFYPYTLGLGIFLLALSLPALVLPRIINKKMMQDVYLTDNPYLEGPVTIGLDAKQVWFHSETLRAASAWSNLISYDRRRDWLDLRLIGLPPIYLPVQRLHSGQLHDAVLELCERNVRHTEPSTLAARYENYTVTGQAAAFEAAFAALIHTANPHAFLIISETGTEHFVQFLYGEDFGFEMDYPVFTETQQAFVADYRRFLAARNLEPTLRPENQETDYFIDCYLHVTAADMAQMTRDVFAAVFEAPEDATYSIECIGCVRKTRKT